MDKPEYRDRLAEAERELYKRGGEGRLRKRTEFMPFETKPAESWHESAPPQGGGDDPSSSKIEGEDEAPITSTAMQKRRRIGFLFPFFLFSFFFFLIALGIVFYRFKDQTNLVSPDNIEISVAGPLSIRAGQELALNLLIENRNPSPLQYVDLAVTFPEGTRSSDTIAQALPRSRESLGEIPANGYAKKTIKAVLFGEEGSEKEITFALEYRVPSSNAIFVKEKSVPILLSDAPVRLAVKAPEMASSGDAISLIVTVTSNATDILRDVYLAMAYPPGFIYEGATIEPALGARLWSLGDIKAGESRSVEIKGAIEGDDEESKVFRFTVGVGRTDESEGIAVPYSRVFHRLALARPQLGLGLSVDGSESPTVVVEGGRTVRADLSWVNNLPDRILDAEIKLTLSGALLDRRTVVTDRGFYDSSNNTITLTKTDMPELADLNPGASGKMSVSFRIIAPDEAPGTPQKQATIALGASVRGRRVADTPETPSLSTKIAREIRVPAVLQLSSRALFSVGPFTNSGPLPPVVGKETTYTILWSLTNAGDDLDGVTVRATLPSYVRYAGIISPTGESLRYTESGGGLEWAVGKLSSAAGYTGSPKSVAFQVALVPSLSQRDQEVTLISETTATGRDTFTQRERTSKSRELTTRLSTDPAFTVDQGTVGE